MSDNEYIWALIARYVDNTLSDEDARKLENWLEESGENRRILQSVDQIWKSSEEKFQDSLIKELNLEKDWDVIAEHLRQGDPEGQQNSVRQFRVLRKRHQFFSTLVKVAALILVAVTSGYLTLQYAPAAQQEIVYEPVFKEITTQPGERANIDLGDGSRVQLNADSKLIMPDRFSPDRREVKLKGQAFFDVKSDPKRPFFIRSGEAVVEVVGTSFDVRSYDDENEIRVVVRDGTVELSDANDASNRIVLNQGYLGRITRNSRNLKLEPVDEMDQYLGWLDGRLIFRNSPMPEVFSNIERWYDVEVKLDLKDDTLMEQEFSADLKTRSVKEVLEVISVSMNFDYEVDDDLVLIYN